MSHRKALIASIALTLLMAIGIVSTRDRLFERQASAGTNVSPTATTIAESAVETTGGTDLATEVTLPRSTIDALVRERADDEDDDAKAQSSSASRPDDEDDAEARSPRVSSQEEDDDYEDEGEDHD